MPPRLKDHAADLLQGPQDVIDWLNTLANRIDRMQIDTADPAPYLPGYIELLEDAQALLEHARNQSWFGPFPGYMLGDDQPAFDRRLYLGACKMALDLGDETPPPAALLEESQTQWALKTIAKYFWKHKVPLNQGKGGIVRAATVLDEIDFAILRELAKHGHALKNADLSSAQGLPSETTCKSHITKLIKSGHVSRKSARSGAAITEKGRMALQLAPLR